MNIILLFLKERQWVGWLAAVILLAVLSFVIYHNIYNKGVQSEVRKVEKQSQAQIAIAQAATLAAQKRADKAELDYATEHNTLKSFIAAHPIGDISQLCNETPIAVKAGMSTTGVVDTRAPIAPVTSRVVQQVPARDPERTPTRRRLLEALAGMADEQSAVIREDQANEVTK